MYTIKGFKKFKGHEGEPLAQGSLYDPSGKKVADWSDDSHGGALHLRFVTSAAEKAFVEFAKTYLADKLDFQDEPYNIAEMSSYALAETAMNTLSYAHEARAELLKDAKKGIAYYLANPDVAEKKSLYLTKSPFTPENVALLRKRHGAELLEIVNETLGLPFVDGDAFEEKRLRALCAKKTLFKMKKPDGSIGTMSYPRPYSPAIAATLRGKYPGIVEFINERFK